MALHANVGTGEHIAIGVLERSYGRSLNAFFTRIAVPAQRFFKLGSIHVKIPMKK